ncbi:hypothetical protein GGR57DRAFT_511282 [Xylariaceae sp. FL1272]|nr:hypothetical protein GGR57DRAFT_511282 [Xylariaceae sp. FL1272]
MSRVYEERDIRYTRERSRSSSGDEGKHKSTTVRRYKVGRHGEARLDRIDRYEEDDDSRSKYSSHAGRSSADVFEIDRRTDRTVYPDRPRSAFDPPSRGSDSFRGDDRYRTVEYEREVERDRDYYIPDRRPSTRIVEETRESRGDNYYWDRRHPSHDDGTDVRFEKRVVRRDSDGDVKIKEKKIDIHKDSHRDEPRDYRERDLKVERRVIDDRDAHDGDVEHYHREVEYYAAPSPPPAPVVIRQKFPEQRIIVQEAPPPAPIIMPRQEPSYIVLRERERERRDDYDRQRDDRRYEDYDEDYYVKRTIIRRDRSSSSDHHKKRHLAEGALAGAGLSALVSSRRGKDGDYTDHRGRKVLAGAALGALGTEVIRRARSAYEDRYDEYEDEDDYRYRHRSKSRSRLTTGLALGAAALAVAGGLKYMQSNKIEKEEAHRGRQPRRYSNDEYSRSRSRSSRGRSRSKSNVAKAGVATAALAGLVQHYRSKSRGKSRSKSRLRTGAEIAAAGLTGAAATKLWERHKDNKDRELSDDELSHRDRSYSRSRSRSRSLGRNSYPRDPSADPELGLVRMPDVQYGSEPLDYDSASEERRRRRHRRRSTSVTDPKPEKKRSKSRLREVAAAGLGTAAAAIGIKKYSDRQKSKDREAAKSREPSVESSRSRERKERKRERRSRDRERRRYEDEAAAAGYPDYDVEAPPPSPPHASGGFPATNGPIPPAGTYTHPNHSTMNVNQPYAPYNPQDYVNLPPPPSGPPGPAGPLPGGHHRPGPENVSQAPDLDAGGPHLHASRSTTAASMQGASPRAWCKRWKVGTLSLLEAKVNPAFSKAKAKAKADVPISICFVFVNYLASITSTAKGTEGERTGEEEERAQSPVSRAFSGILAHSSTTPQID